ncbi:MAG: hypothetical protein QM726_05265 [Chitinophagaceae bacterium]
MRKEQKMKLMNWYMNKGVVVLLCFLQIHLVALSQTDETGVLKNKFNQYQVNNFQEKIFVHTDKTFYTAGEIIWFKIYTVDETFNRPGAISKVAYAELVSEDQKAVLQARVALEEGSGNGSFIIPASLASGSYKLRSYTSRMKNFSADYYYEQPITIVNTLKSAQQKAISSAREYHVNFFPEGGNLVNGIASVVAFKITDQYGGGVNASGAVVSGNDTVNHFETAKFGMGSFLLQPKKDAAYKAVIKINDTTVTYNLPQVYNQGYAMGVTGESADVITITVSASDGYNNLPVYLFVHSRHLVKEVLAAQLNNGKAVFNISKAKLADGISHITIFNAQKQPVCERLYFKRPSNKLIIHANADQSEYATRNKIGISVQAADKTGTPQAADMSVAVFMIDSLQTIQYDDIQSWLLLQSELAGRIESPAYYFSDSSAEVMSALNNLMLTQGWRRFKWEDVLNNKLPAFEFITENEGPVINALLTDKKTGLPQQNVLTTLTVPGDIFELRSGISKADGSIQFNVSNYYSSNEIILQTVNAADSTVKINVASPFSDKFSSTVFPKFLLQDKWKEQLRNRSIGVQADNAYLVEKKKHSFAVPAVIDTNAFYGKAEKQYYLDDYTRFITMEEVLREFVIDVRVRKQSDGYQLRVVNGPYKTLFDQSPLILIDGVPVTNVDKIIAFDPLKIKRIDVATHRHFLGPLACDGIISYKTYQGDLGGYELDPNAVVIEYEGLQREREFYSPVYETSTQKENRIPDLRNLLYWSPTVKTIKDGKQQLSFYTSDVKGNFAIVMQGITSDGLSGSSISTFTVDK